MSLRTAHPRVLGIIHLYVIHKMPSALCVGSCGEIYFFHFLAMTKCVFMRRVTRNEVKPDLRALHARRVRAKRLAQDDFREVGPLPVPRRPHAHLKPARSLRFTSVRWGGRGGRCGTSPPSTHGKHARGSSERRGREVPVGGVEVCLLEHGAGDLGREPRQLIRPLLPELHLVHERFGHHSPHERQRTLLCIMQSRPPRRLLIRLLRIAPSSQHQTQLPLQMLVCQRALRLCAGHAVKGCRIR